MLSMGKSKAKKEAFFLLRQEVFRNFALFGYLQGQEWCQHYSPTNVIMHFNIFERLYPYDLEHNLKKQNIYFVFSLEVSFNFTNIN